MTALKYVRLAERAADDRFGHTIRLLGKRLLVWEDGFSQVCDAAYDLYDGYVLSVVLTAENTSSRDALRDALIASKVTYEHYDDECPPCTTARLADRSANAESEPAALRALLDALLATPSEAEPGCR